MEQKPNDAALATETHFDKRWGKISTDTVANLAADIVIVMLAFLLLVWLALWTFVY